MTVYVLVPTCVYDHGVVGVYESEQLAIEAAKEIWPTTDGHHAFKIVIRTIGETHPDVFDRAYFRRSPDRELVVVDEDHDPLS